MSSAPQQYKEAPRLISYEDFEECKPKIFYGDGGMIELATWFDAVESAFKSKPHLANHQVNFATSTFRDAARSWWDEQAQEIISSTTHFITWEVLKIMMVNEYCPRSVKQMLEREFRDLIMKGYEVGAYTTSFNELTTICPEMVTPEHLKVQRYIQGLIPQVKEAIAVFMPTTFENIQRLAALLTSQSMRQGPAVQATALPQKGKNKRKKWEKNGGKTRQTPPNGQTPTTVVSVTRKAYAGTLPKCLQCPYHHIGPCKEPSCNNCKEIGHTTRCCKLPLAQEPIKTANLGANLKGDGCRELGHFKKDCPKKRGPG